MSTMVLDGGSAPVARSRARGFETFLYRFSLVAFILYALRDAFTGFIRYYSNIFGLNMLWFAPDIMSVACFFMFFYYGMTRKVPLILFFCYLYIFSAIVSIFFMNDNFFSFFSALKMVSPMFVGFCLAGREITASRGARFAIVSLFVLSATGILLSSYVDLPWVGQTIDNFGVQKVVGKLWWAEGGVRYGGFAADSTMAAFMVIFPYFIISMRYPVLVNILSWPLILWALIVATSKTAIIVFGAYVFIYLISSVLNNHKEKLTFVRMFAQVTFLCGLIPFVLIILFGGSDLGSVSPKLASMSDRIDTSWQWPFMYLSNNAPWALFTGCGIGCFSYPMSYTGLAPYLKPVDSFYLLSYLMMGIPFLAFVVVIATKVSNMRNIQKLLLIAIFNIYSVTIDCYGPSFATLFFGYIMSDAFMSKSEQKRVGKY